MKKLLLILLALLTCRTATPQCRVLTLDECREMALSASTSMRGAELDIISAKAQQEEAFLEYLPKVSASAAAFHALNPLIDIGLTDILGTSDRAWEITNTFTDLAASEGLHSRYQALQHGYGATLALTQPLYAGGRIKTGNRLATLGVEAASLQRDVRHHETIDAVDEKYWTVVSLQEKAKTLKQAKETLDTLLKDATAAQEAGLIAASDVLQVRLKISELKSADIQLTNGLKLAKTDLCNLMGMECPDSLLLGDMPEATPPHRVQRVPATAIASHMEETRLLNLRVRASELQQRMILGEALPTVGLGAMYGYGQYMGTGRTNGAVYGIVSIPISDWGKVSRQLRRAAGDTEKARSEREYLGAQLVLKAQKLWSDVETAWAQVQTAEESVTLSSEVYREQQARYMAGMVTLADLLQVQTLLRQAEDALTENRTQYHRAITAWQRLAY